MSTEVKENYFQQLNAVDVGEKIEKKNGLSYLSWAWAWAEVKKKFPDATYTVYENAEGLNYHHDGKTCWVKTGVTINGIEHIEYLPIMNFKNASIDLKNVTSYDVNKAIQRSITKACARHGLGLYIYAGEDLPEAPDEAPEKKAPTKSIPQKSTSKPAITAVVDPSEGVTQEALTACIDGYTAGKSKDEKLEAAAFIKSILGNMDYKNVEDPALRVRLFNHFASK